jgi:hypothetical protein
MNKTPSEEPLDVRKFASHQAGEPRWAQVCRSFDELDPQKELGRRESARVDHLISIRPPRLIELDDFCRVCSPAVECPAMRSIVKCVDEIGIKIEDALQRLSHRPMSF